MSVNRDAYSCQSDTTTCLILTLGEFGDEFAELFDHFRVSSYFSEIRGVIESFRKKHCGQLQILCTCLLP
jgi:hypothetical protein